LHSRIERAGKFFNKPQGHESAEKINENFILEIRKKAFTFALPIAMKGKQQ
jgi:hypothetical protein